MGLKMLISIKFMLHIVSIVLIYIIIVPVISYYHDLEIENERLPELVNLNTKLTHPDYRDINNKTAILEEIDFIRLKIKKNDEVSDRIFILFIFIYIISSINNSLNTKIKRIKIATSDKGELH